MLKRSWGRAGIEGLAVKRGNMKFRHEFKTAVIPACIGNSQLWFGSKFSVRYEQLPANRAFIRIMLSRMFMAKQVQLKRYPCYHSHKAGGYTYQNGLSIRTAQILILHIYSIAFSRALRAKAFEANLLSADDKSFVRALCHRQRYTFQAGSVAALRTGKMGMALALGAVMG